MFHQRLKCLVMNLLFVAGDANGRNDPVILISYGRSDTTGADRFLFIIQRIALLSYQVQFLF